MRLPGKPLMFCLAAACALVAADPRRGLAADADQASSETGSTDLQQLLNQLIDLRLTNGTSLGDVIVVKLVAGKSPGSVRSLTIKPSTSPRQQTLSAQMVDEIVRSGVPLDVAYNKKTRELACSAEKRTARIQREARIRERMQAKGAQYWQPLPESEQQKYVAEIKAIVEQSSQKIAVPLQLLETRYYLFYTDMPLASVGIYIQQLDAMYTGLAKAFDFPEGKNIWRGKCPVLAFARQADYLRFEHEVMQNPAADRNLGYCHWFDNGHVVMSCFKGDSAGLFATILVHETSHGFTHRYKSNVTLPPWINEGVADWVAGTVVGKLDDQVQLRQLAAVAEIRRSGTLGADFFADKAKLETWQYGVASSMVEILVRIDPEKYRQLIDGVKEGLGSEDALREAFGFGFVELTQRYGQLARVPNLQP
ncbi:MAG TPA: hypothetical protein VHV55_11675 [Pirellulales bacterium]|jgi:hypothetical protein|nr:hypothetical protein [Pirellulales bacterium]